jgi:hypothetical protein
MARFQLLLTRYRLLSSLGSNLYGNKLFRVRQRVNSRSGPSTGDINHLITEMAR